MVQLNLYQYLHGYSTWGISKSSIQVPVCNQIIQLISGYAVAMYQMCMVILMVFSAMPDNVPGIREWHSTIDSS